MKKTYLYYLHKKIYLKLFDSKEQKPIIRSSSSRSSILIFIFLIFLKCNNIETRNVKGKIYLTKSKSFLKKCIKKTIIGVLAYEAFFNGINLANGLNLTQNSVMKSNDDSLNSSIDFLNINTTMDPVYDWSKNKNINTTNESLSTTNITTIWPTKCDELWNIKYKAQLKNSLDSNVDEIDSSYYDKDLDEYCCKLLINKWSSLTPSERSSKVEYAYDQCDNKNNENNGGLNAGQITGIVIGCVLVAIFIIICCKIIIFKMCCMHRANVNYAHTNDNEEQAAMMRTSTLLEKIDGMND